MLAAVASLSAAFAPVPMGRTSATYTPDDPTKCEAVMEGKIDLQADSRWCSSVSSETDKCTGYYMSCRWSGAAKCEEVIDGCLSKPEGCASVIIPCIVPTDVNSDDYKEGKCITAPEDDWLDCSTPEMPPDDYDDTTASCAVIKAGMDILDVYQEGWCNSGERKSDADACNSKIAQWTKDGHTKYARCHFAGDGCAIGTAKPCLIPG